MPKRIELEDNQEVVISPYDDECVLRFIDTEGGETLHFSIFGDHHIKKLRDFLNENFPVEGKT